MVLRSDVSGKIQMNCLLSVRALPARCMPAAAADVTLTLPQGMPELKLGLNDMLSAGGGADGPESMGPSSMGRESPGGYSSGGGGGGSREAGCGAARLPRACSRLRLLTPRRGAQQIH